jgi:hypothetical protein
VIGRLLFAMIAALFFLPTVFATVRRHKFDRHRKLPRVRETNSMQRCKNVAAALQLGWVLDLLKRKRPGKGHKDYWITVLSIEDWPLDSWASS